MASKADLEKIRASATKRGITRLCHFTLARTFFKIAQGKVGILSAKSVREDNLDTYHPTDEFRHDGHTDHVCCSIQFPNTYYLKKAQAKETVFKDWVVLMIDPRYLWSNGTKFCPVNAAKGSGFYITDGANGFEGLFAPSLPQSNFTRAYAHRVDCPTDIQAEVLVPDRIDLEDFMGVAFQTADDAKQERERLRIGGIAATLPPFHVCPDFFDVDALRNIVRNGHQTIESKLN
jgi:hypothetical protein